MATAIPRLKRRSEFLRVASAGRKAATPGMVVQALRRSGVPGPGDPDGGAAGAIRVGFTVSRRVGKATVRNRAKRRLRAAADTVLPRCAVRGTDYVLIGRAGTMARPFDALLRDLVSALKRLKSYREGPGAEADRRPGT